MKTPHGPQAANSNRPLANNILNEVDQMQNALQSYNKPGNYGTGGFLSGANAALQEGMKTPEGEAANSIEKNTYALACDLQKFQYTPGMRGSVLGLQTILNSKPGINQLPQTNQNILNEIQGRVNDYMLDSDLQDMYREASPRKIADSNVDQLSSTLKTLFPITTNATLPNGTPVTQFNKQNVDNIRSVMPDAIANPQRYAALVKLQQKGVDITPYLQQVLGQGQAAPTPPAAPGTPAQ